jgi:mono/diheme cytochrome c family protein
MVRLPTLFTIALLTGLGPLSGAKAQDMTASAEEFRNSCASCHGEDGKGAGFLVKLFTGIDPGDLTQLSKNNDGVFPFVKVFQTIDGRSQIPAHGDREMPIWGDRYEVQLGDKYGPYGSEVFVRARVLELVYYIQSIQE